jgi:hypothetical protein
VQRLENSEEFRPALGLGHIYFIFEDGTFLGQVLKINPANQSLKDTIFIGKTLDQNISRGSWIIIYNYELLRPWRLTHLDKHNPFLDESYLKHEKELNLSGLIQIKVTDFESPKPNSINSE